MIPSGAEKRREQHIDSRRSRLLDEAVVSDTEERPATADTGDTPAPVDEEHDTLPVPSGDDIDPFVDPYGPLVV